VSWVFGDAPPSEVEVRLTPGDNHATVLELEHTVSVLDPEPWASFGPGAVGVGWDLALLGLNRHLSGQAATDSQSWPRSQEGREFLTQSSRTWGTAHEAAGATAAAAAAAAARHTTAFYVPGAG